MNLLAEPDNPWNNIGTQPPFVLEEDRPYIEAFNSIHGHNHDRRINLDHTPVPREGPITAPVVLLLLNPSYHKAMPYYHQSQQIISRELESIKDEHSPHLGVRTNNPWWIPRLKELINEPSIGSERLSRNICSIEFFPYRALKFSHGAIRLPSQNYTFALVRKHLARDALFVIARGYELWVSAVPELTPQLNRSVFLTNSKRNITISRRNLSHGVFEKICKRLCFV
jgi:hypothetical protein